ncbi:B12-binding domain-containing protein [Streptomyces sp. NPDC101118]|uniref:B12-binding domain-containing protein n=1 Tax=Streptomyces sp. NPDC101118 TaxID=3366109 RepID=UPI0037FA935F
MPGASGAAASTASATPAARSAAPGAAARAGLPVPPRSSAPGASAAVEPVPGSTTAAADGPAADGVPVPGATGTAPPALTEPGGTPARPDALPSPGTPPAQAASPHPAEDARRELRGLARAAVRLDGPALDALLGDFVSRHGLVAAWEEVMVPALHAVGRKWESSGDRYVEVEHLLSWHVSTALRRALPAGGAPVPAAAAGAPPVLLACVPAEQHTLPLEALAAGLAARGLPVRMLGAAVPPEALDAAVRRTGPAAVVLWSQARSTASHALARHVAGTAFGVRGARTRPLVALAGPGWAGRAPGPGLARPNSLHEALALLTALYP